MPLMDSRGNQIFVEENEVGGHRYWSDSIGGGVVIWDTSLASEEELRLAIKAERQRAGLDTDETAPSIVLDDLERMRAGLPAPSDPSRMNERARTYQNIGSYILRYGRLDTIIRALSAAATRS